MTVTDDPETDEPDTAHLIGCPLVAQAAGITYRQLHHWIQQGYIECVGDPQPGSGARTFITRDEAYVVRVMARLVRVGIRPVSAALICRPLADDGQAVLDGDITVTLTGDGAP